MARTDNLKDFLTDVADAIRTKKGTTELIPANTFDTEIESISGGKEEQSKSVTITQNGTQTVTPDENKTLSSVEITTNVPLKEEQVKSVTITQNGSSTVTPDEGKVLSSVEINTNVAQAKYSPAFVSFRDCPEVFIGNALLDLDTSNITQMSSMFYNCSSQDTLNANGAINNFSLDKVQTTSNMFYNSTLRNIDWSGKSAPNLTTMLSMHSNNLSLVTANYSNLDAPKLTNIGYMFEKDSYLTTANLSNINAPLSSISSLFFGCKKLETINLENINTSEVLNMDSVFFNNTSLLTLDLSSFDTSKVTSMKSMFSNCASLRNLDIRNFDFTNVTSYTSMFYNVPDNCKIIVKDDTAKEWITSKFTNLTNVVTVAELGTE